MKRPLSTRIAGSKRFWRLPCRFRVVLVLRTVLGLVAGMVGNIHAADNGMSEYQLKAAYLFNFVTFTEWPEDPGDTLTLCLYGPDPFGTDIDVYQGQGVNGRVFEVLRISTANQLGNCHIVFISAGVISNLRRVLDSTDNKPVLTVADSPGAAAGGVSLNMNMEQNKVTFEVNLAAVRNSKLGISFQLLRLAKKVHQ
jgi:hypothetical protein